MSTEQPASTASVPAANGQKALEKKQVVPVMQQLGLTVDDKGNLDMPSLAFCIVQSGFFPTIQKASQAIMKMMLGKELGIGPMQAILNVHVITEGDRTSIMVGAHTLAGKIKGSGRYNYDVVQYDATACELQPKEKIDGKWVILRGTVRYTVEDAKKAKLGGYGKEGQYFKANSNWAKDPTSMCFARCVSRLEKVYFPDLSALPMYTPDELGFAVDERGEAVTVKGEPVKDDAEPTAAQPKSNRFAQRCPTCNQLDSHDADCKEASPKPESKKESPKFNAVVISKLVAVSDANGWTDEQALQMLIWEGAVTNVDAAQVHLDNGRKQEVQDMLAGDEKLIDVLVEKFKMGPEKYMAARTRPIAQAAAEHEREAEPEPKKKAAAKPKDDDKPITKDQADDLFAMVFDSEENAKKGREFLKTLGYSTYKQVKRRDYEAVANYLAEITKGDA